ncbi:MAG: PIG-L deacetylase family protein [Acidimicrobiales bacterium]
MAESLLVISAHAADFVWRAGGAIALYRSRGHQVCVVCLSYGERGESARFWRQGLSLPDIKMARHAEAEAAAEALGVTDLRCYDADDYPIRTTPELELRLVRLYRELQPTVVLTHTPIDPYNQDHATASRLTLDSRVLAQAPGVDRDHAEQAQTAVLGAPPVFFFEPHQTEMCQFRPDLLLDISEVWERKLAAMHTMAAQEHLWDYYTDVAKRRGVQAARNSGPNLGHRTQTMAEAFQRLFPQIATELT